MKNPVGRPLALREKDIIVVTSENARTKLQQDSERRALINFIIDCGGGASLERINENFGYNMRPKVLTLINLGWLAVSEK